MNDLLTRFTDWLAQLANRVDENLPFRCNCGHWVLKKDACYLRTTWGAWVSACSKCWEKEHQA